MHRCSGEWEILGSKYLSLPHGCGWTEHQRIRMSLAIWPYISLLSRKHTPSLATATVPFLFCSNLANIHSTMSGLGGKEGGTEGGKEGEGSCIGGYWDNIQRVNQLNKVV